MEQEPRDFTQFINTLLNGTPEQLAVLREEEENRERTYRRGWQQGFAYAGDVFLALMAEGVSEKDIRNLIIRFEEDIMRWRARGGMRTRPPFFNRQQIEEQIKSEQENEDDDA